jgi:uncharacterized repeat protein (TIGR03847 family)
MSPSWDLPDVDRFTAGTVGPPGERVFYLQAVAGTEVVTLRLEKQQVAAMAQYLAGLLSDLPPPDEAEVPVDVDLVEPVQEAWIVGQIGIAFDEDRDRMVVSAEEIEVLDPDDEDAEPVSGGGVARVALTRGQVQAFIVRAARLVTSGRPTCPLCGRPVDSEGHTCLKTNGHKPR